MSRIIRPALALGAVFFALAITGCGGDDVPSGDVAKVDKYTISEGRLRPLVQARQRVQPGRARPTPPDVHEVRRRQGEGRAQAGQGPADAEALGLPQAVQERVRPAQAAGHDVPGALDLARGRGRRAGRQGQRRGGQGRVPEGRQAAFPKKGDYAKFLKSSGQTEADLVYRQTVQLLEKKITDKIQNGAKKPTAAEIEDYYKKNLKKQFTQPAARDLRVVLTNNEPGRQEGQGGARRGLTPGSRVVAEVLDRPDDQGRRRRAAERDPGHRQPAVRARGLHRQEGRDRRAGQDVRRLLRLRGHKPRRARSPQLKDVKASIQSILAAAAPPERAGEVRPGLPGPLARQDRLREGLRLARLQPGQAAAQLDGPAGRDPAADARRPPTGRCRRRARSRRSRSSRARHSRKTRVGRARAAERTPWARRSPRLSPGSTS